ncbi:thioesterase II family protein [Fusibacter sp. JL298sf-3]
MNNRYFVSTYPPERQKRAQLFSFPYAGGGCAVFKKWQSYFQDIEVLSAQYPGRENRMGEAPIDCFEVLLEETFDALQGAVCADVPYYLFGHSLGTKLAYELALLAEKRGLKPPEGLILSAGKAPCYGENAPIHHLEEDAFVDAIGRFSGTPKEILENRDLMRVFLPMLRADFTVDETYVRQTVEKLNCPILGLMGTEDTELTLDELVKWQDYSTGAFGYKMVKGAHLFVNTHYDDVIAHIQAFIHD